MKSHCPHGHAYTPENIYKSPSGYTYCRECKRSRDRGEMEPSRPYRLPVPFDLAQRAKGMTVPELSRHYERDRKVVVRWLNELGIKAKPSAKPGQFVFANAGNPFPSADASLEGRAADHLRRFYLGVYRSTEAGAADPKGTHWRAGNTVLSGAELVERAKAKGFDPLEWKRIAA